jgi:hypothetical protein
VRLHTRAIIAPHLLGRSLRGPPGGLPLVSAVSGDETANPPFWQLPAVIPVTVLVMAAFISIPAHVGARRPAAETSKLNSPDARQADMRRTIDLTAIGEDLR